MEQAFKKFTGLSIEKTDYQNFTTKNMPVLARRKLNVGDIWSNSIECKKCGDIIRSKNRHDMVYCSCNSIFVDGGSWYSRQGGDLEMIIDRTESFDELANNTN